MGASATVAVDQSYMVSSVRREGSLSVRCADCGKEHVVPATGVRERFIELENARDAFERKTVALTADLKAEEDKRKAVEQKNADLIIKLTEIETKELVGVDVWQISPNEARALGELRAKSGEEAYAAQLTARREQCGKVKALHDQLLAAKNANIPAGGATAPGTNVIPAVIPTIGAPVAPAAPATKAVDPFLQGLG